MTIPARARDALYAVQRRDGRIRIAGQSEAWVAVGLDPRDCLAPGQRGAAALAFGRDLSIFCASAVARLEGDDV